MSPHGLFLDALSFDFVHIKDEKRQWGDCIDAVEEIQQRCDKFGEYIKGNVVMEIEKDDKQSDGFILYFGIEWTILKDVKDEKSQISIEANTTFVDQLGAVKTCCQPEENVLDVKACEKLKSVKENFNFVTENSTTKVRILEPLNLKNYVNDEGYFQIPGSNTAYYSMDHVLVELFEELKDFLFTGYDEITRNYKGDDTGRARIKIA